VKTALFVALLLSVPLDTPFVSAEASALQVDGEMMWVEAVVDTDRDASVMLVRAVGPDDQPLDPVAMQQQGTEWRTRMFLPRRSDIRLAFEHIDAGGTSFTSRPAALIELGVDAAVFSLDAATPVKADGAEPADEGAGRTRWGWLALGLGAAAVALALVAFATGRTVSRSGVEGPTPPSSY
jgi:hypothetical protein